MYFQKEKIHQALINLNNPMTATEISGNKNGKNEDTFSLVSVSGKSCVVETLKKAEDENGYIVRLCEMQNMKEEAEITFGFDVRKVYECDCLENNICQLETDGRSIKLKLNNFEIKTLRVVC